MSLASTDSRLGRRSYYAATAARAAAWPALQGDADCDVAVVGGGLAGVTAALELAERGFAVRLLEAQTIGFGASGRNGGQAIYGLACDPRTIERQLGRSDAQRVWAMTLDALALLRARIARHRIDCDWRDGHLDAATSPRKAHALHAWAERLECDYGYALQPIGRAQLPRWIASDRYHAALYDRRSGHLHPLKYLLGLAQAAHDAGVRVHEHTPVQALQPGARVRLTTPQGVVQARHVLLAANVYLQRLAPRLAARIMPVGTYIACTEPLDAAVCDALIPSRAAVSDTDFVLDYFRTTADQRLLYGGRVSYSTATPANLAASMRRRMLRTFPQLGDARVAYAWGGFVDITRSRAPDFGRLPAAGGGAANVYYLQGFCGHGVALAGLAGKLVAEAIAGDAARFDLFARLRHRPFPGGPLLRMPTLVLGMAWYRLKDLIG